MLLVAKKTAATLENFPHFSKQTNDINFLPLLSSTGISKKLQHTLIAKDHLDGKNGHQRLRDGEEATQPFGPTVQLPPHIEVLFGVSGAAQAGGNQPRTGLLQVPRPAEPLEKLNEGGARVEDVRRAELAGRVVPGKGVVVVVEA